jgi:hypothetical protein
MSSTRRDLLLASGKAFAAQAVAGVLGAPAKARASGGRIKAVAFDAFTVFDILSVDAVIEGIFRGKGMTLGGGVANKAIRVFLVENFEPHLCRFLAGHGRRVGVYLQGGEDPTDERYA